MESSKRRSRSLNELPGHLRVPVLRRKDTERTQARLEAGVAGLAELRLLKEKQMALVEQTVTASIKHKQRPFPQRKLTRSSENLDDEVGNRKQKQVQTEVFQPWQSTTSLCSITEKALSHRARFHGLKKGTVERLRGGSLCLRSTGHSTGSLKSHEENYYEGHSENHQNHASPLLKSYQGRRQAWQEHKDVSAEINAPRESLAQLQGKGTQVVQNFRPDFEFCCVERQINKPCSDDAGSVSSFQYRSHLHNQRSNSAQAHWFNHKRAASLDTPFVSKQTPNLPKKMSWDNLLVLAGLQPMSFDTDDNEGDDVFSQSLNTSYINQDNVSSSEPASQCTKLKLNNEKKDNVHAGVKKSRSYSFCCDNGSFFKPKQSLDFDYRNSALDKMDTVLFQSKQNKDEFCSVHAPQTDKEEDKAKAIIRRASIQCETVLTGGRVRNRKIFNPLHEIDVVALQSPGPLHAVTLQYKSIPLNALPEKVENIPARGRSASVISFPNGDLSNHMNNGKAHTGSKTCDDANKSLKQPMHHGLHTIQESGNKTSTETVEDLEKKNHPNENLEKQDSCRSLSELETKSKPLDHFNDTMVFNRTESRSPKEEVCLSTKANENSPPSPSLTEGHFQENVFQPVSSSQNFDPDTLINYTPPWILDGRNQFDISSPISSTKSHDRDIFSYPLSPESNGAQSHQMPDESLILSDDGYSTCDSLAPQSRLSIGPAYSSSSSTSDRSSLSSGSVSNVSIASTFLPSSGLSTCIRNQGFRHLRCSHPPKSFKIGSDLKFTSCGKMHLPPSALSQVPEATNSEMTLCQEESCILKEPTKNSVAESHVPSFATESAFNLHKPLHMFDSVFADDITLSIQPHTRFIKDSGADTVFKETVESTPTESVFEIPPNSSNNDETKSSIPMTPTQNNFAVVEKGSVIQLDLTTSSENSSEGQNKYIPRTNYKYNAGRIRMIPNKNVQQTAV